MVDASYKPNRDSVKVGWEQVAGGYRRWIEMRGWADAKPEEISSELDTIQSLFTTTSPGARPLLYRPRKQEASDAID